MRIDDRRRQRLRLGCAGILVLGLAVAGFGLLAPRLSPDRAPVPVPPGRAVPVPDPGPFGGDVLLYAAPTRALTVTQVTALGCSAPRAGGTDPGTTTRGAIEQDRLVIDGRAVLPVLVLTDTGSDVALSCTGPAAAQASPMFLVTTYGVRDLVPMAAWSLAVLAVSLGAAGAWLLRPEPIGR